MVVVEEGLVVIQEEVDSHEAVAEVVVFLEVGYSCNQSLHSQWLILIVIYIGGGRGGFGSSAPMGPPDQVYGTIIPGSSSSETCNDH